MKLHFGVKLGHAPLFSVEMEDIICCILHMKLRIVGALFHSTVAEVVSSEKMVADIQSVLTKAGVWVKDSKINKKQSTFDVR